MVSLAIVLFATSRASAQVLEELAVEVAVGTAESGALRFAGWLAELATTYSLGKVFDQIVDARITTTNEAELTSIQLNLQNLYKKSMANHTSPTKVAEMKATLATIDHERHVLQDWRSKAPTREELDRYRKELAADVATLKSTLAKHEKILQRHGRQLQQLDKTVRKQGGEIAELEKRLDQQEQQQQQQQQPPQQQQEPTGPPRSLTVVAEGASNVIRLHTERWCEVSDVKIGTGIVHVTTPEAVVDYCVARGTSAVVEIAAPNVWVSMPASLSDLVEIQDNGRTFHRSVYPDP
jgi:phage shock protein A